MSFLQLYFEAWAAALTEAVFHSLVQGLGAYLLIWMLFKAFPEMRAQYKYLVASAGLMLLFVWFATILLQQLFLYLPSPGEVSRGSHIFILSKSGTQASVGGHFYHRDSLHLPRMPWVLPTYFAGLCLMLLRLMANLYAANILRHTGKVEVDLFWAGKLDVLARKMKVRRKVLLHCSIKVSVPTLIGTIRPLILLPVATLTQLSVQQAEAILLHELAHIRRYDYLANLVQSVIEVLLFFNPFLWLISGQVRKLREECCDALVVHETADPLSYAQALALLESHRTNPISLAATGPKHHLLNRIKKIIEMKSSNQVHSSLPAIAAVLLITCFIGFTAISPTNAQKVQQATAKPTGKAPITMTTKVSDDDDKQDETPKNSNVQTPHSHHLVTADSPIINIMLHDSSVVWAKLAPNPYEVANVISIRSLITLGTSRPDWDEMSEKLQAAIDRAYHHPDSYVLNSKIRRNVADAVNSDRKSMENVYFRDEQAHTRDGLPIAREHHEYADGATPGGAPDRPLTAEEAAYVEKQVRLAEENNVKALANSAKAMKDAEKAQHDLEKMRPQMDQARRQADQARTELEKQRPRIEKARVDAERARLELEIVRLENEKRQLEKERMELVRDEQRKANEFGDQKRQDRHRDFLANTGTVETHELMDALKRDGFVIPGTAYNIKISNKGTPKMWVNGKRQPPEVAEQYGSNLPQGVVVEMKGDEDDR